MSFYSIKFIDNIKNKIYKNSKNRVKKGISIIKKKF